MVLNYGDVLCIVTLDVFFSIGHSYYAAIKL